MRCRICERIKKHKGFKDDRICYECKYIMDMDIHALRPASERYKLKSNYLKHREAIRRWHKINKPKISAYQKKWRQENMAHILQYQKAWRAKRDLKNKILDTPLILPVLQLSSQMIIGGEK